MMAASDYTEADQHHKPRSYAEIDKRTTAAAAPVNQDTEASQRLEPKIQSSAEGGKKKPILPPKAKPKCSLSRQQDSSESMYMRLSTSTTKSTPTEYMALCNATRQQPGGGSHGKITGHVSRNRLEGVAKTEKPSYLL